MDRADNYWVFGYGSLIWRPGFGFASARGAQLSGFHRALCIYSRVYRGTPQKPGLVFGLVPGGTCQGRAFEITPAEWPKVLAYLRERETRVYNEVHSQIRLDDQRTVSALCFVADERHADFANGLALKEQLEMVRRAHGDTGSNRDYVVNTMKHLEELGLVDEHLANICALLGGE